MKLKEIAKRYGVTKKALRYHFENYLPKYLLLTGKVEHATAPGSRFREWIESGDGETWLPLKKVLRAARSSGVVVCSTPREIERGRQHSTAVRDRLAQRGEPERWGELVATLEKLWPGFRVIQPIGAEKETI